MSDLFSRLGLNTKETDVFRKLLTLGAQPISVIAKHAGIPRSSMYFITDKLKSHHLIEEFERAGVRYVKCIAVEDIADVLKTQERNIRQTLLLLEEQLPELKALESTLSITPKVTFLEGKDSVLNMYQSLSHEKEFCTFFNPSVFGRIVPVALNIIPDILQEQGSRAKEILTDCKEAKDYRKKFASERHQIRLLPKSVSSLSDCIICRDRVCFVTYGEKEIAAVELFSKTLAATQQTMFDQVWKSLE